MTLSFLLGLLGFPCDLFRRFSGAIPNNVVTDIKRINKSSILPRIGNMSGKTSMGESKYMTARMKKALSLRGTCLLKSSLGINNNKRGCLNNNKIPLIKLPPTQYSFSNYYTSCWFSKDSSIDSYLAWRRWFFDWTSIILDEIWSLRWAIKGREYNNVLCSSH